MLRLRGSLHGFLAPRSLLVAVAPGGQARCCRSRQDAAVLTRAVASGFCSPLPWRDGSARGCQSGSPGEQGAGAMLWVAAGLHPMCQNHCSFQRARACRGRTPLLVAKVHTGTYRVAGCSAPGWSDQLHRLRWARVQAGGGCPALRVRLLTFLIITPRRGLCVLPGAALLPQEPRACAGAHGPV